MLTEELIAKKGEICGTFLQALSPFSCVSFPPTIFSLSLFLSFSLSLSLYLVYTHPSAYTILTNSIADIGPIEKKREGVAKQMVATSSHLRGPASHLSMRPSKRKAGTCTGKNPVNIERHMLKMTDGNNRQDIRKEILHSTSLPRCKHGQDDARVQEPLPASSRRQERVDSTIEGPLRASHLVLVC